MTYRRTISVDFDGVLHAYDRGWSKRRWFASADILDGPVPGAMKWLHDVYLTEAFDVAIFSSRSKTLWGILAMQRWLRRQLLDEFGHMIGPHMDPLYVEILDWVRWPIFKPAAHLTIDDRALTFTGQWPAVDTLRMFKPWNKP